MIDPPCLIGGSTPPWGGGIHGHFDAYCATVKFDPGALVRELLELFERAEYGPQAVEGGKVRFYASLTSIIDRKGYQLAAVKHGGSNPHPFVECQGYAAPLVAEHLRNWFDHSPSRIDHAIDREAQLDTFDRLDQLLLDWCKERGLSFSRGGDWATPDAGRTIYIGSRKSMVFVRIYEKGLKYAHDLGLAVTDQLRRWLRFELEFKPQNRTAKVAAETIEGPQMWGSTLWTADLAKEVLKMDTKPISIRERRESNFERALRFGCSQYHRPLNWLLQECEGDYEQFGRAVADYANLIPAEKAAS